MKRFPLQPAHPERLCWGCERLCARGDMLCGNGSERTAHPVELFGADWFDMLPAAASESPKPVVGLPEAAP